MSTAQVVREESGRTNLLRDNLELPPLPVAAQRLLGMVDDDDVDIDSLAEVIELDPAMTARIVGLSRSAFFGDGSNIHSVKDAILRVLGLNLVRSLALSMSLSGVFQSRQTPSFDLERYWCTALLTGSLARQLVPYLQACGEVDPDQAYLAGLLHSLGYLPLVHCCPAEMESVFKAGEDAPEWTLAFLQREQLGVDYQEAGVWLGVRWSLPPETVAVMKHHNDPEYRGDYWKLSLLILHCTRLVQSRLRTPEDRIRLIEMPDILQPNREKFSLLEQRFEQQYDTAITMAAVLAGTT